MQQTVSQKIRTQAYRLADLTVLSPENEAIVRKNAKKFAAKVEEMRQAILDENGRAKYNAYQAYVLAAEKFLGRIQVA
jgi:ABC-type Zn uptake system ZnuABC Zn-binding protein ZnuA